MSVQAGESIALHISTIPSASYRLSVYRLGHYGGLGARLIVELERGEWREGQERSIPVPDPQTGLAVAVWPATDYIQTGEEWLSGQYLAVLQLVDGEHAGSGSYVPFVVRRRRGVTPAPVMLQMPVTTAQAHNHWGGRSLACTDEGVAASKVSFDRPFPPLELAAPSARWPLWWDLPLLRFLESAGIDLEYAADFDVHRQPQCLLEHSVVILSGHSEYWSPAIRSALEMAADRGVSIACMGADTGSRCIEFESGEHTIVASALGPRAPGGHEALMGAVRFRDPVVPRPESALLGVQSHQAPRIPERDRPYVVTAQAAGDSWLDRTGLHPGDSIDGLIEDEWDAIEPGLEPPGTKVLFEYASGDTEPGAHAVRFRASSGAIVFSAGSLRFSTGLEHGLVPGRVDPRLQRFMRNALADLVRDRRVDERAIAERDLLRPPGQADDAVELGLATEIPVRASADKVWPVLSMVLAEWRERTNVAVAAWDANFSGDLDAYLQAGHSALWNIARALAGAGMAAPETILDLPCGTGRVTRALRAAWPAAQLVAADVSEPAINFCAGNFAAEPWRLETYTQLGAAAHEDRYDLIWSSSLLSQIPPVQIGRCLSSLLALLRPNGVLVAGYHGRDSANRFRSSADPGLRGLAESLAKSGTGFHAREDGSGLGVAVLSPQWLAASITLHRGAMLLSLSERGWLDHVDVVVVMRKNIHHPHGNIELC